jgi:DNA-binding transcriptional ArsR family regulator
LVLKDALKRIQVERTLSQKKTVRELLLPLIDLTELTSKKHLIKRYPYFCRDFWTYLKRIKCQQGELLAPIQDDLRLQPGEERTLNALKKVSPNGLTIDELGPLTKKDAVSDETAPGSLSPWLSRLKKLKLVRCEKDGRANRWYFVKDFNS